MNFGFRKPSLKKSFSARTTGCLLPCVILVTILILIFL